MCDIIKCNCHYSMLSRNYHQVLAFVFAMNEINRNANLLPNNTLEFEIYTDILNAAGISYGTMNLLFRGCPVNYHCGQKKQLMAVIGGLIPQNTIHMPNILYTYKLPQV